MGKWRGGIYTRSSGNGLVSRFVQLGYLHAKLCFLCKHAHLRNASKLQAELTKQDKRSESQTMDRPQVCRPATRDPQSVHSEGPLTHSKFDRPAIQNRTGPFFSISSFECCLCVSQHPSQPIFPVYANVCGWLYLSFVCTRISGVHAQSHNLLNLEKTGSKVIPQILYLTAFSCP